MVKDRYTFRGGPCGPPSGRRALPLLGLALAKRPGRPLLPGQEADNAEHPRGPARVEHTFARMRHYKILRDCRQRGNGLHYAVQAVATLHNPALAA